MRDNSDRELWVMIDHCVAHHNLVDCAHRVQPGVVHAWTTSLIKQAQKLVQVDALEILCYTL